MREMRTYLPDDDLSKYGVKLDSDLKMNEEFYASIMSDVNSNSTGIELAYELYKSFNKKVSYNEIFKAFEQDLSIGFVNDIYNRGIEKITLEDSAIICTNWALAYAYLLEKNGFNVVINKNVMHNYVYFVSDGHLIKADATNNCVDPRDGSNFSDLTRCKLDILPCGFMIYEKNNKGDMEERKVFDSVFFKENDLLIDNDSLSDYTTSIIEKLNENSDYSQKFSLDQNDVISNFSMISELVNEAQLDTIGSITYIHNLIRMFFSLEDQKKMKRDYLKMVDDDGSYSLGFLTNYCSKKVELPKCYLFHPAVDGYNFLYTKKHGLQFIEEDMALDLQIKNDEIELSIDADDNYQRGGK